MDNHVGTTSDVTFNQVSTNSLVFGNPTTYSHSGISGSVNITGSLTTSGNVTVSGNMTVLGTLTAQEFKTTFVSSSILFESGSTKLGDTTNDTHERTGSLNVTGSWSLNGYEINEISNDSGLTDQSCDNTCNRRCYDGIYFEQMILLLINKII